MYMYSWKSMYLSSFWLIWVGRIIIHDHLFAQVKFSQWVISFEENLCKIKNIMLPNIDEFDNDGAKTENVQPCADMHMFKQKTIQCNTMLVVSKGLTGKF